MFFAKPVRWINVLLVLACVASQPSVAAPGIADTKHNLSASGPGTVTANDGRDQVCVFCHTPHGATSSPGAPLWNKTLSGETYDVYTSTSLDAETIMGTLDQPGGSSKLCLSCHDGTLALGTVNVLGGVQNVAIGLDGTDLGKMPAGPQGKLSGFTRNLDTDLTNDHPISLNFTTALATADTELYDPVATAHIGVRAPGFKPEVPLEATGGGGEAQIQCATCHDPHKPDANSKFLRLNRFQKTAGPTQGSFDSANDIVCLGCHDKEGWAESAHASSTYATETYSDVTAAGLREFPTTLQVWEAACLNCHDTHTEHGSRRLLREGNDAFGAAIEDTCYQCHSATPIISNAAGDVKDIASDFALARSMPIETDDQIAATEKLSHAIDDANFTETSTQLQNRHAECTDCHNPHRVMRNTLFNGSGTADATHDHTGTHSNIASGALRGSWGVEPVYGATEFLSLPVSYQVKEGDGGTGASTAVGSPYVTREYQICLKCHSDYGYADNNVYPTGNRPNLGDSLGGTPTTGADNNGLTQYTNQAMEFQAPSTHRLEPSGRTGSGAGSNFEGGSHFNHRSWHPVMVDTGRTTGIRSANANGWLAPFNGAVGSQTMYCTDCHGNSTAPGVSVPTGTNPWGPHGSDNDFILKGLWNSGTGGASEAAPGPNNDLCFKCHNFFNYANEASEDVGSGDSGFSGSKSSNLHGLHIKRIGRIRCMWCHVAVPHGWKNKALLVNLNDVGPEAGLAPNTEIAIGNSGDTYNQQPYYFNAKLKVRTFAQSGQWEDANCGSAGANIGGNNTEVDKVWMGDVCSNPP